MLPGGSRHDAQAGDEIAGFEHGVGALEQRLREIAYLSTTYPGTSGQSRTIERASSRKSRSSGAADAGTGPPRLSGAGARETSP